MTDSEINELIERHILGYLLAGPYVADNDGRFVRMADAPTPDYCNDPAAWGVLLAHLGRRMAQLSAMMGGNLWQARMLKPDGVTPVFAEDSSPGRALVLAALRAHGVSP